TRSPGSRTSGIADSGCFGFGERLGVTGVEDVLEAPAQRLALEDHRLARPWLQPHDLDAAFPAAVTPRVALSLAERPQSSHVRTVRPSPDGSCTRVACRIVCGSEPQSGSRARARACSGATLARMGASGSEPQACPGSLRPLERGHRQAVVGELLPVVLGGFAMAGPHDRAAG